MPTAFLTTRCTIRVTHPSAVIPALEQSVRVKTSALGAGGGSSAITVNAGYTSKPPLLRLKLLRRNNMGSLSPRTHLDWLEAEAIYVLREVAAECERPVLLFSGGKDSAVLLKLAEKAFRPGAFPFPLMHIDTGHNYPEVIAFRDARAAELGETLIVRNVQDSIDRGTVVLRHENDTRNGAQAVTLLEAIEEFQFDACIGGARRDEEKARAKERFVSFRDEFGQWDPKAQRPELWRLFNTKVRPGENLRVFPISNW